MFYVQVRGYEFYTQDAVSGLGRVEDMGDGRYDIWALSCKGEELGLVMDIVGEKKLL